MFFSISAELSCHPTTLSAGPSALRTCILWHQLYSRSLVNTRHWAPKVWDCAFCIPESQHGACFLTWCTSMWKEGLLQSQFTCFWHPPLHHHQHVWWLLANAVYFSIPITHAQARAHPHPSLGVSRSQKPCQHVHHYIPWVNLVSVGSAIGAQYTF